MKDGLHCNAVNGAITMVGDGAIDVGELTACHVRALAERQTAQYQVAGIWIGRFADGIMRMASDDDKQESDNDDH